MADIRPFLAIRPAKEKIADIAELPYDVFSREEARALVEKRPHSFLTLAGRRHNLSRGMICMRMKYMQRRRKCCGIGWRMEALSRTGNPVIIFIS